MSKTKPASWFHRKAQLQTLLACNGEDDEEGIALDRLLHGQSILGKTQTTIRVDAIRFSDNDLSSFGPLAEAQFGQVELVNCLLDNRVYVRKRVSKKFALRSREQFSPQTERHILLLALKSASNADAWIPRILCAYQCPLYLNIVMEYAAGGSLWDVLESSPCGRLDPADLTWWAPQCVAAIGWLHSECGFAHRDIKPHNFVFRPNARLLLIDFGCAAPLLPPDGNGARLIAREHCLVPCGTCDYISPEILLAHEEALVALEMSDDEGGRTDDSGIEIKRQGTGNASDHKVLQENNGYGCETDWWSLGAMLYELAYGVAPFFANDIRQTYVKIMAHETSLSFDRKSGIPSDLVKLIKGLLTHRKLRLGRRSMDEVTRHAYFIGIDWSSLHSKSAPPNLHLPQFTYTTPLVPPEPVDDDGSLQHTKPFAFSALFQSSTSTRPAASPGQSFLDSATETPRAGRRNVSATGSTQKALASFIGFSWGPPKDAFDDATRVVPAQPASASPALCKTTGRSLSNDASTHAYPFVTPVRPRGSSGAVPPSTIRVTSTRRSAQARPVSDREAMHQLVDLVGVSARKRVLESGKKPRVLRQERFGFEPPPPLSAVSPDMTGDNSNRLGFGRPRAASYSRSASYSRPTPRSSVLNSVRKELRFDDTTTQFIDASVTNTNTNTNTLSSASANTTSTGTSSSAQTPVDPLPYSASEQSMTSGTDGPPSPSPSPRPGSAMSMLSMRRSATPTASSVYLSGIGIVRAGSEPSELTGIRTRTRSGSLDGPSTVSVNTPGRPAGAYPNQCPNSDDQNENERENRCARFEDVPATPAPPRARGRKKVQATPHPQAKHNAAAHETKGGGFAPPIASPASKPRPSPKPKPQIERPPASPATRQRHRALPGMELLGYPQVEAHAGGRLGRDMQVYPGRAGTVEDDSDAHSMELDEDAGIDEIDLDQEPVSTDLPISSELARREARWRAKLEEVQLRYEKLLRNLARVHLQVDQFAADVRSEEAERPV